MTAPSIRCGRRSRRRGHRSERPWELSALERLVIVGAVSSGKNAVVGKADALVTSVTGVVPDSDQVKHGARKVGIARENPAGLAIGGAAVGFLVGLLIPSTQIEDEKLGDMADDVKSTVKETGQEALERGKQVAQEAAGGAKEKASESAQQQSEEMASSLKESAKNVAPTATG